MRDGETRAQRRAMAAIENEKLVGVSVVQRVHDAAAQIFAGPGGAKSFAFDAQERDFVERIDHPQPALNSRQSMMRTGSPRQICSGRRSPCPSTMRRVRTRSARSSARSGQKAALHGVDVAHAPGRKVKARVEQNAAIVGEAAPQLRGRAPPAR